MGSRAADGFPSSDGRLLVAERLDGRVVDVVKSEWFHIFLLMFFHGCFTAFRKSRCLCMGVLLSRKQKARRFFCELSAVLFCEGREVSPSYKSNGDTPLLCTLWNFIRKNFCEMGWRFLAGF